MENYHIAHGTLRVNRDLRQDFDLTFDQACAGLIADPSAELLIDLTPISYISSTYVGMIAATFFQAQAQGKSLSVRARPAIIRILQNAGFANFIKLESVPPPAAPSGA